MLFILYLICLCGSVPSAHQLPGQQPSSVPFPLHLALAPGRQDQADSDIGTHSIRGHLESNKTHTGEYSTKYIFNFKLFNIILCYVSVKLL